MRRLPIVVCLCAIGLSDAQAAAGQPARAGMPRATIEPAGAGRLERLERWLKAVARHMPGEDDEALLQVAAWPNGQLQQLWVDANVLVQMIRNAHAERFIVQPEGHKNSTQVRLTKTDLHRLHVLACAAGGALVEVPCMALNAGGELDVELRQVAALARTAKLAGDDNYVLRRGAILHSDIAMLAPLSMDASGDVGSPGPVERVRVEISDGRAVNLRQSAVHWEIARMLLEFVRPPHGSGRSGPGGDEMVRQWYRATASWMQLHEDHDRLHLDRARELFPADPDVLFLSGCQRETFAGPPIQTAMRSAVLPTGVRIDIGSERAELREAEGFFHRVLEIRPDHAEARLRDGRVLGALGKHAEAAVELRRALAELQDAPLRYYAALFLGFEEETLGHRPAARAAYEQAASLAPRAQSPLLALSWLERRDGDRGAALSAIARLFSLPGDQRDDLDDPWWSYSVAQARDADQLLDAMRRPYASERLP